MSITGIILAGGQGRRMGGADKGLVEFLGKPLVSHVIQRLTPQVDEILVSANREIETYAALGHPVISDAIEGFAGPLAGLHMGMTEARHPYVLTVPCDTPLLPMSLVERLMRGLTHCDADVAIAKTGIQAHPVFCLCRKTLLPHLEAYLQSGGRKFGDWYSTLDVTEILFNEAPQAFININTREELLCLEQAA
ncbi:MAG TPA: molybdenum cofactor guanylyltransferase MobA [Methylophilaceae bacterium]|nr:molybdenum cofactor guanylyltransferase MobA [Methylophilaceae bacterium]